MTTTAPIAFQRILIPLDGSLLADQALPYALAIAGDAELVLVAVTTPPEARHDSVGRMLASVDEIVARDDARAREMMRKAAQTWLGERPGVRFEAAVGDPAEEILRVARTLKPNLILLASHGRGAAGRVTFGSVADRVSRYSPVPVLIVRPHDAEVELSPVKVHRLVVPLDGSTNAEQALPVAEALARQLSIPVVLVESVDLPTLMGVYADAAMFSATLMEDAEAAARIALDADAATMRAKGIVAEAQVWRGAPFSAINEAVRAGDIIVMTTHGRTGLRRWALGSVAEKLIRNGSVPVMIVPLASRASSSGA